MISIGTTSVSYFVFGNVVRGDGTRIRKRLHFKNLRHSNSRSHIGQKVHESLQEVYQVL